MSTRLKTGLAACWVSMLLGVPGYSPAWSGFDGGHIKGRVQATDFPDDSLFSEAVDSPARDQSADLRLNFSWGGPAVGLQAEYQLIGIHGDQLLLSRQFEALPAQVDAYTNDDRRMLDLTHVFSEQDRRVVLHRLDRLSLDLTGERAVARIGRQALSWGNGLVFTPMDIVNPFDPTAVDREYKSGDDMLYAQILRDNGDDLQGAWVARRDAQGEVSAEVASIAAKYHGFAGEFEYDLLLAQHYDDPVLGVGGLRDIGGAILRGDLTLSDSGDDVVTSAVLSLSHAWVIAEHNITGFVEYYYNGFGQPDGDYSLAALQGNPELLARIDRGELFTLGKNYLAASATVEMTPLWLLTPNLFLNLDDGSALFQLVSNHDFGQDWQLLGALGVPVGPAGTEYGGIDSGQPGQTLATGPSLFLQLARYF